jgi:RNAse (barnase) inhibitor barstar
MRYEIDGSRFATLEEFFEEVSRVLIPGQSWGRTLDAFNDILRGGFGTPSGGFVIHWKNHALSKHLLAYPETVRQLELRSDGCHPESRENVLSDLERARAHQGPTAFDWLIEIIKIHCRGGREEQDGVVLILD